MHIRNITACPPLVFKKQLDLHLSPILDCPCTPNFNNSLETQILDDKLYYVVSLRVTRLTNSQLNNQNKKIK